MNSHVSERPWGGLLVRTGVERRPVVLLAALLMFAAIFAAMRLVDDPAPGIGLLAVLPVMLIGLELGLRGGLAAAVLAAALLTINAIGGHPELGVFGVATRSVVFAVVGGVAGRFSDRMRHAYAREEGLLRSGLELGGAVADERLATIVARAAARTPGVDGARVRLDGMAPGEAGRAAEPRLTVPIVARGSAIGRLDVTARDDMRDEDRAALELLARQAGLAADNRRLLARERERAGVEAELMRVRDQLTDHRSGLELLLSSQEEERQRVAGRLHEDLAQILSAVLMGLRLLDRDLPEERAATVDDLRRQVTEVLRELRDVAGSLRPPSLDQLGLPAALEALADDGRLELDLGAAGPLSAAVETTVFRIVQDALAVSDGDGPLGVRLSSGPDSTELELRLPAPAGRAAVLPAIRARAEALSGEVTLDADGAIRLRVPA